MTIPLPSYGELVRLGPGDWFGRGSPERAPGVISPNRSPLQPLNINSLPPVPLTITTSHQSTTPNRTLSWDLTRLSLVSGGGVGTPGSACGEATQKVWGRTRPPGGRSPAEDDEWWARLAVAGGLGKGIAGMEGEGIRRDWSRVDLTESVGGEDGSEEGEEVEDDPNSNGPAPAATWANTSTSTNTSPSSSPAILTAYTPLSLPPTTDYFSRPSNSSSSASSTPAWPSPQSPFLATPLFSPAGLGARTPSTAPSSPVTAKAHSRHNSLTFTALPVTPFGSEGGNLLGLDLFGEGGGATALARRGGVDREEDADADVREAVHGSDKSSLGVIFSSILAWTLSPATAASLELAPHDDNQAEDRATTEYSFNSITESNSLGTLGGYTQAHSIPYASWSPLSPLSSLARDRFLSSASPAALAHAEVTAHATPPAAAECYSSTLLSGPRFELGELEDYELTWQTDANEVEAGIDAVLGVLIGMGSFI